jgi:rRNA maturation protein Nop10
MTRETKARKTTATGRNTEDHCPHCGRAAKVKDGRVLPHPDPQSAASNECAGSRAKPLTI